MTLLYAVEAWILSIVAWAWLTLRDLIPERPLLEELSVYSTLLMSTLNLLLSALVGQRGEISKAYLGFVLAIWTFMAYVSRPLRPPLACVGL